MDELQSRLAEILGDPESMEKVREMAQGLFSGGQTAEEPAVPNTGEVQQIIGLISKFKSSGNDPRTRLLEALKPNLSEERRERVDTAIKLLRIIEMLPLIRESGLIDII